MKPQGLEDGQKWLPGSKTACLCDLTHALIFKQTTFRAVASWSQVDPLLVAPIYWLDSNLARHSTLPKWLVCWTFKYSLWQNKIDIIVLRTQHPWSWERSQRGRQRLQLAHHDQVSKFVSYTLINSKKSLQITYSNSLNSDWDLTYKPQIFFSK